MGGHTGVHYEGFEVNPIEKYWKYELEMAEIKSLGIWFSSIKISMIIYEFSG